MIRVLIVAEHIEVREGLCNILRLAGSLEISGVASSLDSALRLARDTCPDVALVDLEMPGGEGYGVIQQLRRQFPGVKPVALTAHELPSTRERAIQAGAWLVIVKGLELPEMVAAVQSAAGAGHDLIER